MSSYYKRSRTSLRTFDWASYNPDPEKDDYSQSFLKETPQRGHSHVQCGYCSSYTLLKEDNVGCRCASCNAPLKL